MPHVHMSANSLLSSDDARSDPPGGAPVDSGRKFTTRIVSICIGVLFFFSALLNVAQYEQAHGGIQHSSLGGRRSHPPPSKTRDTVFALDKPSEHGTCGKGLAHMCVERRSGADDPEDLEVCWCGRPSTVFALDKPSEHGTCGKGLAHMCVERRSGADDPEDLEVCWCGRPSTVFTLDKPSKDGVCDEGLVDMCVDQSSVPNGAPKSHHPGGDENVDVARPPHHHSDPREDREEHQKICELVCGGRDPSLPPSLPPPHYQPSPDEEFKPPSPDDWNENEEFELKALDDAAPHNSSSSPCPWDGPSGVTGTSNTHALPTYESMGPFLDLFLKIKIPWIQYFYLHEDSMSWEALGEAGDKLRFFAHSLCSEPPIVCDEFAGGKWTKWDTLDVPNTFFGD